VDEVAERLLALPEGTRLHALFPLQTTQPGVQEEKPARTKAPKRKQAKGLPARGLSDALKARLSDLRARGFNRLYQNRQLFEFSTPESLLDVNFAEPVFLLVDRLTVSPDARARLVDAIEIGYRESGEIIFETVPRGEEASERLRFSQRFECKGCQLLYQEPEPRLFSFNNPYGACPRCQGFGNTIDFDLGRVIPNPTKTLSEGAIEPWTKPQYRTLATELKRLARPKGIPLDIPWAELEPEHQRLIIEGEERFPGIRGFFRHLERKKYKLHVRVFLSRYRGYSLCSECRGARLRLEARQVKICGKNICEVSAMTVEDAGKFFAGISLRGQQAEIAGKLLEEIQQRLRFLNEVGLEYLTLDRLSSTLSGGEAQRIQLATSLGSRLVGTLYVLDEPSIGLHSRDTHRLIKILHDLRDLGNTILVVEHDPDVMRASDIILDLGPGAGENGGRLVAAARFDRLKKAPGSLTGRYLAEELRIPVPNARRTPGRQQIRLYGARAHNLKNLDLVVPLRMLVAITGVSGSGKSTLLHDVLFQALAKTTQQPAPAPSGLPWDRVEGAEFVDEVVMVDQSPIGRTPRSNPVTYIKAFDAIRDLFASLPEAHKQGLAAGHFSFNVPGGRCEACQGDGTVTVEMQFLADVELTCEECKGTRYKPQILDVRYHGKNIHEVLNLTIQEALQFFAAVPKITAKLQILEEVGLGYLRLGQSATTLSGGEAQRMKLAAHLQPRSQQPSGSREGSGRPHVLYIFDEPTTGLHFDDISKLLSAFRRLIAAGGSILVIEHNLEVIKTADWVIDLGPEGGERGGYLVGSGPPEAIAQLPQSYTGQFLARVLNGNGCSRNASR
jgi:excinuclease ABC subunit A